MKLLKLWMCALVALGVTFLPTQGQDAAPEDKDKKQDVRKPGRPGPKKTEAKPGKPGGKKPGKPGKPDGEKPNRPERPEIPDELKSKMETYKKESQALREEMKATVGKLDDPTRQEAGEAVRAFREANKERYDAQKALVGEIRDGLKAARPERPEKPELSAEAKALREKHQALLKSRSENLKKLREALAKASEDERKELIGKFREDQDKLAQELKELHKEIRESVGGRPEGPDAGGDKPRRPRPKPGGGQSRPGQRRPTSR